MEKKVLMMVMIVGSMLFTNAFAGQTLKPGENKVSYMSEGQKLAGLLYLPADYQKGEKRPAIVFIRPGTGVKEQTAGLYAKLLSKKGFVTLAFDPRGFGESEGLVRLLENPFNIADDAKNGVSYISGLQEVDPRNVFQVGICMGAGYAVYATAFDPRIKALATISPYLHMSEMIYQGMGAENIRANENFQGLGYVRQADYGKTDPTMTVPVPPEGPASPIAVGMRTYYLNKDIEAKGLASHANWINQTAIKSNEYLGVFSAFHYTRHLSQVPFFMAVGKKAEAYPSAKDFFSKLTGPKKLKEFDTGHFELYWMPKYTTPIVEGIAGHFNKYLVK